MAKRKAARTSAGGRKKARKPAPRASARPAARKGASKKTARKGAAKKTARKAAPRKAAPKKAAPKKAAPRRSSGQARKVPRAIAPKAAARKKTSTVKSAVPVRKAPALNRPRRAIVDDDIVQSPPSSLDLDRTASAARSGRKALQDRFNEHTETSPALTGGDVDADWESAYSVGDEAPGGDNPTPDQDIVDDIGKAVGLQYQDNEELKGAKKVEDRDKKRWELDPASAEDWEDR